MLLHFELAVVELVQPFPHRRQAGGKVRVGPGLAFGLCQFGPRNLDRPRQVDRPAEQLCRLVAAGGKLAGEHRLRLGQARAQQQLAGIEHVSRSTGIARAHGQHGEPRAEQVAQGIGRLAIGLVHQRPVEGRCFLAASHAGVKPGQLGLRRDQCGRSGIGRGQQADRLLVQGLGLPGIPRCFGQGRQFAKDLRPQPQHRYHAAFAHCGNGRRRLCQGIAGLCRATRPPQGRSAQEQGLAFKQLDPFKQGQVAARSVNRIALFGGQPFGKGIVDLQLQRGFHAVDDLGERRVEELQRFARLFAVERVYAAEIAGHARQQRIGCGSGLRLAEQGLGLGEVGEVGLLQGGIEQCLGCIGACQRGGRDREELGRFGKQAGIVAAIGFLKRDLGRYGFCLGPGEGLGIARLR